MRKAIGIVGLVLGILQGLIGVIGIISFIIYVVGMAKNSYVEITSDDVVGLISVFSLLFGGAGHIVVASLALGTKHKNKTVAVWAIVIGAIYGWITLILGLVFISNLNKPVNSSAQAGQTALPVLTGVDAEIEMLKKQIYLAKLKQELENLS